MSRIPFQIAPIPDLPCSPLATSPGDRVINGSKQHKKLDHIRTFDQLVQEITGISDRWMEPHLIIYVENFCHLAPPCHDGSTESLRVSGARTALYAV